MKQCEKIPRVVSPMCATRKTWLCKWIVSHYHFFTLDWFAVKMMKRRRGKKRAIVPGRTAIIPARPPRLFLSNTHHFLCTPFVKNARVRYFGYTKLFLFLSSTTSFFYVPSTNSLPFFCTISLAILHFVLAQHSMPIAWVPDMQIRDDTTI